jgi:cbb3-type cytochrome oxidase maturation protein
MNILLVLIPISLLLIGLAVWAFFWAVNHGQFDDLETPALRILEDDPPALRNDEPHSSASDTKAVGTPDDFDAAVDDNADANRGAHANAGTHVAGDTDASGRRDHHRNARD